MPIIQWGLFILGSALIIFVSRRSLRSPRLHGFYRFFAFEAILGIVLLNLPVWFKTPFAPHQLISWVLLLLSLFLVVHGFTLLHRLGRPDPQRADPALLGLEKTTRLVTSGAYRFIRHPLYASLLYLGWGAALKHITLLTLLTAAILTAMLYATARVEEAENLRTFGAEYADYMRRTKRFIPFIF
jgi:protein-S-isoprenylcysteine O-methyltransferase Ste14